ncbi:MAG: cell division protein FtsZ [Pseudomonadota bacterium]
MAIQFKKPDETHELTPHIVVIGVGGAGGNAVNNMIEKSLDGVEFVAANTDSQALQQSKAPHRLQLGAAVTRGLGAGARPEVGREAAHESADVIGEMLEGANMCFITAGMGGGTGTGAAPVIARAARERGVLTVGVVTKPFAFEGVKRMRIAEQGIAELQGEVDTLIVIPNQNLFRIANEKTTFAEAFVLADDVLYQGVKGVTDLMVRPGVVNLDFADVRAVMDEMGKAMMGSGEAEGERRAIEAAEAAIDNPLLDEVTLSGARGVLINITGGPDLKLFEVDEAANRIRKEADPEASVFFGSALDPTMEGRVRVSVVATGIDADQFRAAAGLPPEAPAAAPETRAAQAAPEPAPAAPEPRAEAAPAPAPDQEPAPAAPQTLESFAETVAPDPVDAAAAAAVAAAAPDEIAASQAPEAEAPAGAAPPRELVRKLTGRILRDAAGRGEEEGDGGDDDPPKDKPRVEIPSFLRRQA